MQVTRPQLYALVDAFEADVRALLSKFVSPHIDDEELLGPQYTFAAQRREQEGASESVPLSYFLDLRPAYDLLNARRGLLPKELASEVRELTPQLDTIVAVRNRVMHPRPFQDNDRERLVSALNMFSRRWWPQLHGVLHDLAHDPNWSPARVGGDVVRERVLHNLPLPEYDDTGLQGRDTEVGALVEALNRGRDNVITLVGEGGIGKTALALDVAYRLLDDEKETFDAILWVSLKTERLTGSGVVQLNEAVISMLGAAEHLGRVVSSDFVGGIKELAEYLDGISCLICLDNLETVNGDEFVMMYEQMPANVKFLVTSREGIGQIERRVGVGPLTEQFALRLLNRLITLRSVPTLKSISSQTRREIVHRLRFSPLGIRWFILAVEAGRSPRDLLVDQQELLDYCISSVYESVSSVARMCLVAMHALRRPVTVDDLVLLTEQPSASVKTAVQELTRGSLVSSRWSADGSMSLRIEPSESARSYLDRRAEDDPVRRQVADAEYRYRQDEERRTADIASRALAPIVIRTRYEADAPSAQILRRALLKSQGDDFEAALSLVAEAKRLNPEYWEVYRVEAFLNASNGSKSLATPLYLEAYRLATEDEHIAVVAHFFGGHLARNEHDLPAALKYQIEAHRILATPDTALALANNHVWSGRFEEGIPLLESAASESVGKSRLIAITSHAEAYRRWSEHLLGVEKNVTVAFEKAMIAQRISVDALREGIIDSRILATACEAYTESVRCLVAAADAGVPLEITEQYVSEFCAVVGRLKKSASFQYLERVVADLNRRSGAKPVRLLFEAVSAAREFESGVLTGAVDSADDGFVDVEGWERGAIDRVDPRGFGFIEVSPSGGRIFFHRSTLVAHGEFDAVLALQPVWFTRSIDAQGRECAGIVSTSKPAGPPGSLTENKVIDWSAADVTVVGRVKAVRQDRGFGFVSVDGAPLDVFFHRSACDPPEMFGALVVGESVEVVAQTVAKGIQAHVVRRPT